MNNKSETSMKELESIIKNLKKDFNNNKNLQRVECKLDSGDTLVVKRLVITTGGVV